jgi:hypothetical protein
MPTIRRRSSRVVRTRTVGARARGRGRAVRTTKVTRVTRTVRVPTTRIPKPTVRQAMLDQLRDVRPTAVGMSPTGMTAKPPRPAPVQPPAEGPVRRVRVTKVRVRRTLRRR